MAYKKHIIHNRERLIEAAEKATKTIGLASSARKSLYYEPKTDLYILKLSGKFAMSTPHAKEAMDQYDMFP